VLISAFSVNKDAQGYFEYFSGLAARVIAISFAGGRDGAQSAQSVADAARAAQIPAQTAAGLREAVHDALEDYDRPRIVICGSLYLAGEVLALGTGDTVQATPG
jgi:dihydrofolate synthase/folylpolyglutamate synthase